MSLLESDTLAPVPEGGLVIRVRYRPELPPDCVIELRRSTIASTVELATWSARPSSEQPPALLEARAELCPDDLPISLQPPVDPFGCAEGVDQSGGRGGARFEVSVRSPTRRHAFVEVATGASELCQWMYLVARHALRELPAQRALDQLYRGCALHAPPWADLGGAPRLVRVFGTVTRGNAAGLRELLAAIPESTPTLVDLSSVGECDADAVEVLRGFDLRMERAAYLLPPRLMPDAVVERQLTRHAAARRRLSPQHRKRLIREIEHASLSHQLKRERIFIDPEAVVL